MHRYKITVEYDGTELHGWQRQDGPASVQQHIEEAILQTLQTDVRLHVAGRTDAGVHAIAQVAHFDCDIERDPYRIMQGINHELRGTPVALNNVELIPDGDDFHARFTAKRRYYMYRIINRPTRVVIEAKRAWHVRKPLDIEAMREGANHLIGKHDFTSFRSTACQAKSPIKDLDTLDITELDSPFGREIRITTDARSFLHNQVRNMVGTLSLVGQGKWQPDDIKAALDAKNRTAGGTNAPPHGLYFMKVDY